MSDFLLRSHCESRCSIGTKQSLIRLLRPLHHSVHGPRNDKIFIILLTFYFFNVSLSLAQNDVSPSAAFYRGNLQYKDGSYREAIASYESIREKGLENGALYYNLGNSYFKDGQLGKAILNYERAQRLMPRDSDLKSNHEFALAQVKNYTREDKSFLQNFISRFKDYGTKDEMAVSLLVIYLFLGICFLSRFYWNSSKKIVSPILMMLGVVFISQTILFSFKIQSQRYLAIVLQNTEAKFEPTLKATTHFPLSEGQQVIILDKEVDYLKVKRPDGKIGWVPSKAIERI